MAIPRRKFRTISASVEKITKPIFGKRGFGEAAIVTDWPHIVGATMARHTIPEQISFPRSGRTDGTLKLKIDSSALALELQHLTPQLIEKINTYFGYTYIKNIKIKIINSKYVNSKKKGNHKNNKNNFDDDLKKITDINLKNKLEKLINAYNEKK